MKNKFVSGSLILTFSIIISKVLGAFYRIPLTNIIGVQGIGIYQLVFPVYSLFLCCSSGITTSLAKVISSDFNKNENESDKNNFLSALIISIVSGIILSGLLLIIASPVAKFQGNESAKLLYYALSLAILLFSITAPIKGLFQGRLNMTPTAVCNILEQVAKLVFGLLLASLFIKQSLALGVLGAGLGIVIGEGLTLIYLIIASLSKKRALVFSIPVKNEKFRFNTKLFKLTVQITLGIVIFPLANTIISIFVIVILNANVPIETATTFYGLQTGIVLPLINLPIILISSLCTALLPNASNKQNAIEQNELISSTFKFCFCFMLAITAGYILLAPSILRILFSKVLGENLFLCTRLFLISSIGMFFLSLAQILTTSLQVKSRAMRATTNLSISGALYVVLALILCSFKSINIYGLAIAGAICYLVYFLLNYIAIKHSLVMDKKTVIRVVFSVVVMSVVVEMLNYLLKNWQILNVLICSSMGFAVFCFMLILFKVYDLKKILSSLAINSKNVGKD